MLPHAPGVQMADIPEDSVDINKEKEAEDEGGEADKDKRLGVKIMDKRVEPENEFESGKNCWHSNESVVKISFIFRKVWK